jgi:hypothetical protein
VNFQFQSRRSAGIAQKSLYFPCLQGIRTKRLVRDHCGVSHALPDSEDFAARRKSARISAGLQLEKSKVFGPAL